MSPAHTDNLTISVPRSQPATLAKRGLLVLVALMAVLMLANPASAARSCGRQVLDDWYDGRIDGTYDLHCYDDAIEIIPPDVRDYSSAEDDIRRALQAALRGQKAPPNSGGGTVAPPAEPIDKPSTTPTTTTGGTTTTPPPADPDLEPEVTPKVDQTESTSSVPIPLLILAGLALLLVTAGSAGYLVRRFQGRRVPPPAA